MKSLSHLSYKIRICIKQKYFIHSSIVFVINSYEILNILTQNMLFINLSTRAFISTEWSITLLTWENNIVDKDQWCIPFYAGNHRLVRVLSREARAHFDENSYSQVCSLLKNVLWTICKIFSNCLQEQSWSSLMNFLEEF